MATTVPGGTACRTHPALPDTPHARGRRRL